MQGHATLNSAIQRRLLVAAEIDAHVILEREKNTPQIINLLIVCPFRFRAACKWPSDIRMIGDAPNCARDLAPRKHRIAKASSNRAALHGIELPAPFTLGQASADRR